MSDSDENSTSSDSYVSSIDYNNNHLNSHNLIDQLANVVDTILDLSLPNLQIANTYKNATKLALNCSSSTKLETERHYDIQHSLYIAHIVPQVTHIQSVLERLTAFRQRNNLTLQHMFTLDDLIQDLSEYQVNLSSPEFPWPDTIQVTDSTVLNGNGIDLLTSIVYTRELPVSSISFPATTQNLLTDNQTNKFWDTINRVLPKIKKIIFAPGITEISHVFYIDAEVHSITTILFPASLKRIEQMSFTRFKNLTQTLFQEPSQLSYIGGNAFSHCYNLTSIALPTSIQEIKEGAFLRSGLTSIHIPKNCKKIEKYAFWCNLTTVTFDQANTTLLELTGERIFGIISETTPSIITIPPSVKKISNNAFHVTILKTDDSPENTTPPAIIEHAPDCIVVQIDSSITNIIYRPYSDSSPTKNNVNVIDKFEYTDSNKNKLSTIIGQYTDKNNGSYTCGAEDSITADEFENGDIIIGTGDYCVSKETIEHFPENSFPFNLTESTKRDFTNKIASIKTYIDKTNKNNTTDSLGANKKQRTT